MSLESAYYENPEFWSLENTNPEDLKRFKEIYTHSPENVQSVLDVGCGNGLFLNYLDSLNSYQRLHGLDRSQEALKYVTVNKSQGSADSLPFSDKEFDLVTSLEAIEHFPINIYHNALQELCRVAKKYILITVPNDQKLELSLISCPQCKTCFNPDYHVRSFTKEKMKPLLENYGFKAIKICCLGEIESFKFQKLIYLLAEKSNPFPYPILCPLCGYDVPPRRASINSTNKNSINGLVKPTIKKLIPKQTRFRWILALYERTLGP